MIEVRLYPVVILDIVLLELVALYDIVDIGLYSVAHFRVDLLDRVCIHSHVVGGVQRRDIHHGIYTQAVQMILGELQVYVLGYDILYLRAAFQCLGHNT